MADQAPQIPTFKPGDFVFFGRFKNKSGILKRVYSDEKGVVKIEIEPVPKGRKKSRTRNLFSIKLMSPEDARKAKALYDEETIKIRQRKKTAQKQVLKVAARYFQAMVMPPRQPLVFVNKFEAEFKRLADRLLASQKNLDTASKQYPDAQYSCQSFLKDLGFEFDFYRKLSEELRSVQEAIDSFQRLVKARKITKLRNMDTLPELVIRGLRPVLSKESKLSRLVSMTDPHKVKQVSSDPDKNYAWDAKYQEGLSPEFHAVLAEIYDAASALKSLLARTHKSLSAFVTGELEPEKVETLYHASVKAKQIYQHGFAAEMPKDQLGLGGSQSTKAGEGISFTYDLKAALDIARSFKEAALIAVGEIKASSILEWGVRETELEDFVIHLKSRLEKSGFGQRVKIERSHGRWVVTEDDEEGRLVEKGIDQIFKTPEAVFNVYDAYLWAHPTRLNPVHMNRHKLINYLKTSDPKDIGVVSAKVDMTNPNIFTAGGEREYRVPPAAVIEVTRFYQ